MAHFCAVILPIDLNAALVAVFIPSFAATLPPSLATYGPRKAPSTATTNCSGSDQSPFLPTF